jgi:hypothetical protein
MPKRDGLATGLAALAFLKKGGATHSKYVGSLIIVRNSSMLYMAHQSDANIEIK